MPDNNIFFPIVVSFLGIMLSVAFFRKRFTSTFLTTDKPRAATLIARQKLNHNTFVLTFDTHNLPVQLPVGKHMQVVAEIPKGNVVQRAYTPTAVYHNAFDLLIKVYRPTERFPKGGAMSQYLETLPLGADLLIKGPVGRLQYLGKGEFELVKPHTAPDSAGVKVVAPATNPTQFPLIRKSFKNIGMIAGGSGITPMYQVIKAVEEEAAKNATSLPKLSLIFGNQTPDDILLHKELETLAANKTVQLALTVDRPAPDWKGLVGFMDEQKIKATLPQAGEDTLILVCGPPLMNKAVREALEKLGHRWIHVF